MGSCLENNQAQGKGGGTTYGLLVYALGVGLKLSTLWQKLESFGYLIEKQNKKEKPHRYFKIYSTLVK